MHHGEADGRPEQSDERRVEDFLTGQGWLLSGSAALLPTGGARTLHFQVPGCIGIVRVALLPPNGEMASLFARTAKPDVRVFYAYRGRVSHDPPRFAYLRAKLAGLMGALGFRPRASSTVVAVSQPQGCRIETSLPWSEL